MNDSDNIAESCATQRLSNDPNERWTIDELGQRAEVLHREIECREEALAPAYWQLGETLNLARKNFAHGQWSRFLAQRGIDKGRASKARAIHRTFKDPREVERMSVHAAYERRKRQSRRGRRGASDKTQSKRHQQATSIGDWLMDACQHIDFFCEEAAHLTATQARPLRDSIDVMVDQLQRLRTQLDRQNDDSECGDTASHSADQR